MNTLERTFAIKFIVYSLLGTALFAAPSFAQSGAGNDWRFRLTPYLFATGLDGKIGFNEFPPAEVEASFSDILDNMDFAFMLYGDAKKGRWGIWGDAMYVKLGLEPEGNIPLVRIYSGVDIGIKMTTLAAGGSYSLVAGDDSWLDIVVGARYWSLDQEVTFIGFNASVADKVVSADVSWTDPLIGLRGQTSLSDRWRLSGQAIASVGGQSESSVDVLASVGYSFSDLFTLSLGYRYLDVDYDKDGFLFDVQFTGPGIGFNFIW